MSPCLAENRCACGQLLFKGLLADSVVEIRCKRCKRTSRHGAVLEDLLAEVCRDGRYRYASSALLQALGYDSLVGRAFYELCEDASRQQVQFDFLDRSRSEGPFRLDLPLVAADGIVRRFEGTCLPLRDDDAGVRGFVIAHAPAHA